MMVAELENEKLKQSHILESIFKKHNDMQDHNVKLKNKVSILHDKLQLSKSSLHKLAYRTTKLDKIFGVQLVGQKYQGLGH